MVRRWNSVAGLLCGCGGTVVWALGLTMLQPRTEPAKPWHDVVAGNNTYWARDLRWMALLAVLAALVLAARGRPLRSAAALLGTVAWLGLDLYLDRTDLTGRGSAVALAFAASAVVAAAVVALGRQARPRTTRADSSVLLFAAMVAGATAPIAGALESPTDTERALNPAALAAGALLATAAIAGAVAAAPTLSTTRAFAALGLGAVTGTGLLGLRLLAPQDRFPPLVALAVVLLTGIAVLRREWPETGADWGWYVPLALGCAVGYPVLVIGVMLGSTPLGARATAFVGNPPVNAADEDVLLSVAGLCAGLVLGAAYLLGGRIRRTMTAWTPYSAGPR